MYSAREAVEVLITLGKMAVIGGLFLGLLVLFVVFEIINPIDYEASFTDAFIVYLASVAVFSFWLLFILVEITIRLHGVLNNK